MPLLLIAQAADKPDGTRVFVEFLVAWFPILVVFVIVYWILRSANAKANPLRERSMQHMQRIESQTDEMVSLLKEIRDQRKDGGS